MAEVCARCTQAGYVFLLLNHCWVWREEDGCHAQVHGKSFGQVGHFFLSLLGVQWGCAWSILARRDYRLRVLELFFKWNWKDCALLVWWQSEYSYLFFCHGFTGSQGKFKTTYGEMMERHAIARVQEFREVTEKCGKMFSYEVLINWHACEQF